MKIQTKRLVPCVLAAACALTGCRIGGTEYVFREPKMIEDKAVFSVNEQECELPEAMIYLCNYKNLYGSAYGIDLWEYEFEDESLETYVKDMALAELVRITCMDILAEEREMELEKSETDLAEKAAEEYYGSLSEDEIAYMGVKQSDVVAAYEHYALAMKLYQTLTTSVEKEVSDDEARVMRIQQIFVADEETADVVADKLEAGEDFSAVAGTYNEADTIEIYIARGDMPDAVENVAFELDDGAVSGKIAVDGGYYFIRCLNKFEEELTEANKDVIRERMEKGQFEDVYNGFVSNAVYEQNDELWDSVTIEENEDIITTEDFFRIYTEHFEA
jgi:foldase protein PrsA